jgi:hypothetical protein
MFSNFFRKLCRLWDNVGQCGGAKEATNDDTIWQTRVTCWINKEYAHAHPHAPGYANARTHKHVTLTAFYTAAMIRASVLRYTYTACLINLSSVYITRIVRQDMPFASGFFRRNYRLGKWTRKNTIFTFHNWTAHNLYLRTCRQC